MTSRRTIINLVWFGLISALFVVWAVGNILRDYDPRRSPYQLEGRFASSVGLLPGNEVAYLGVPVGDVKKVERVPGGVRVRMEVDEGERIPAGSTAHIFRKSAIGETYVNFSPPEGYEGEGGPWLRDGDRIPIERTTIPLEFSELLRSASDLISGIPPEDVRTLVHELATGLQGRVDSLRTLADAGDRLGATFAARTEVLDRLATNNTRLTRVVTEHRGSLGQSLSDLRLVSESLRDARGDLSVLLDRGSDLLTRTSGIVANQKGNLDCVLKSLELVIDTATTPEQLAGLRTLLQEGPPGFGGVWDSRDTHDDGVWVRVGFLDNRSNPAPQFVPPKDLPKVNPVAPCASPLRPTAIGTRPAAATSDLSAPATGLLALVLAGVLAAAVLREVGLRSPR